MSALLNDADLIDRIFAHVDANSTDKGKSVWREPTANYVSPERFADELEVLRRVPVAFCPSAALPEPGAYIARTAVGTPLLVVRGTDRIARGFRNACRHRGMKVAQGEGCKRAFACPYHAWTYGLDGTLRHVPGVPDLRPPDYVLFNRFEFEDKANWKLMGETSMEGYHIRALHGQSFYPYGYDNLTVVELHGRNSRIVFPFRRIEKLREAPRGEWSVQGRVTDVHQFFPNGHVTVLSSHAMLIILEPLTPSQTRWVNYQLAPRTKNGKPLDIAEAKRDADFVRDAGLMEDRNAACAIQEGLASGANSHFTFGHYEQAIGHFHRHLAEHLEMLEAHRSGTEPNRPA